jgi:nucleotide-binding universal stress UspA family protein
MFRAVRNPSEESRAVRILLAVDGSDIAIRAVQFVVRLAGQMSHPLDVVLVNVDPPLATGIATVIGEKVVSKYHAGNGEVALDAARKVMDASRLAYDAHMLVGDPAEMILKLAASSKCDFVVMGSHGGSQFKALLLGSVTSKVLAQCHVPVTVVGRDDPQAQSRLTGLAL